MSTSCWGVNWGFASRLANLGPTPGGGFDVVNSSGVIVSEGWGNESGAAERAEFLNARKEHERAEAALTGPQRRVYAVAKRDGAVRSGYRHNLVAVRGLHAAGLVRLTEYGAGSWTAAYVPPPVEEQAVETLEAGPDVARAGAGIR